MKNSFFRAAIFVAVFACQACKKHNDDPQPLPANRFLSQVATNWSDVGDYTVGAQGDLLPAINPTALQSGDLVFNEDMGVIWRIRGDRSAQAVNWFNKDGSPVTMSLADMAVSVGVGKPLNYSHRARYRPSKPLADNLRLKAVSSLAELQSVDSVLQFSRYSQSTGGNWGVENSTKIAVNYGNPTHIYVGNDVLAEHSDGLEGSVTQDYIGLVKGPYTFTRTYWWASGLGRYSNNDSSGTLAGNQNFFWLIAVKQ